MKGNTLHVALLRGINVGGHRRLPMAELRALCEQLGFVDPQTYVQSGNVVFGAEPGGDHGAALQRALSDQYGYDVPTIVLTAEEFLRVAAADPHAHLDEVDPSRRLIVFLHSSPVSKVLPVDLPVRPDESARLVDGHVYLSCPGGYGKSKLDIALFERLLGVAATARNVRTVRALCVMIE